MDNAQQLKRALFSLKSYRGTTGNMPVQSDAEQNALCAKQIAIKR